MTPKEAYHHCKEYGRNSELEKIIINDPQWAYFYAKDVIEGRWIEGEKIILTDPDWAYYYARYIIKGRWIEAENIISTNSKFTKFAFYYAQEVINGKLPEIMHNMMLLHADKWAKHYFDFINKLKRSVRFFLESTPEP